MSKGISDITPTSSLPGAEFHVFTYPDINPKSSQASPPISCKAKSFKKTIGFIAFCAFKPISCRGDPDINPTSSLPIYMKT